MEDFVTPGGAPGPPPARRSRAPLVMLIAALVTLLGLAAAVVVLTRSATLDWRPVAVAPPPPSSPDTLQMNVKRLAKEREKLARRLDSRIPKDPYILVDTSQNKLFLKKGSQVLREAVCSTGSYKLLESPDGRRWFFQTPRGMFRILGKQQNPVWIKPDWAFIEEGEPVPAKNAPERYDAGALGLYAMSFGNGYLIHGTLYRRLLGKSVTHGCVRLDDEDLEFVYNNSRISTRVYIY